MTSSQQTQSGFAQVGGAWVHESAQVDPSCVVEPGSHIGPNVELGPECVIEAGAIVRRDTIMGRGNRVSATAVLGGDPQDASYAGEPTKLIIGDGNVFREGVTLSRGSTKESGETRIGNGNFFMANSHVGHDSVVEDRCVLSNGVLLAGHCLVETGANFGGGTAVGQFVTVGRGAFIGGMCGVRSDAEPYMLHDSIGDGKISKAVRVNTVGLDRSGVPRDEIRLLQTVFKMLFRSGSRDIGGVREMMQTENKTSELVEELLLFCERKQQGRFGVHKRAPK